MLAFLVPMDEVTTNTLRLEIGLIELDWIAYIITSVGAKKYKAWPDSGVIGKVDL